MKSLMLLCVLIPLMLLTACKKTDLKTFTVGDETSLTNVQTTEGESASVKINTYAYSVPFGTSLSWDGLNGLEGRWNVEMRINVQDNTDAKSVVNFTQSGKVIHSVLITELGSSGRKAKFSFESNGGEIKIRVQSTSAQVGVRLDFKE